MCTQPGCRAASIHRNPFLITSVAVAVSAVHRHGGLGSLQNSNTVTCWHTSSIYIWINVRKIQIHEWNAGRGGHGVSRVTLLSFHYYLLLPFSLNSYLHSSALPWADPSLFPHLFEREPHFRHSYLQLLLSPLSLHHLFSLSSYFQSSCRFHGQPCL